MKTAETTFESIADDFLAKYRAGERPSSDVYAQKYPELADEIVELLESVKLMEQLSESESAIRELASKTAIQRPHELKRLGDFEIFREIGRGGMGVVYEATGRSLGRRVALKVLHASALVSTKHVGRFRRESQLAAQLHHTNIVSVFGVGEENETHFYAMQFVDGVTVENTLDGLRCLSEDDECRDTTGLNCRLKDMNVAAALKSGEFAQERKAPSDVKRYSSPNVSTLARDLRPDATTDDGEAADVNAEAPCVCSDDAKTQPCPANSNESSEVSDDLQRFLDDRPIRARRVTPVEHFWRWCRRNRGVATLAAMHAQRQEHRRAKDTSTST